MNSGLEAMIAKAGKLLGLGTERRNLVAAIREYLRIRKQRRIVRCFGTIDFDPNYDYKLQRLRQAEKLARIQQGQI